MILKKIFIGLQGISVGKYVLKSTTLISENDMVEGKKQFWEVVLWLQHKYHGVIHPLTEEKV